MGTAGHVLNPYNYSSASVNGLPVYSPGTLKIRNTQIGTINYVFPQTECGRVIERQGDFYYPPACTASGATKSDIDYANRQPDIGLIFYGWKSVPYNNPSAAIAAIVTY